MSRPAIPRIAPAARSAGSAGVARARLHSALARDRGPHDARALGPAARPAPPSQPDLLDHLLAQAGPSGGGRP
jgi:hypothetical protein